jgi:Na+-driven multidrug efflux pump
VVFLFSFDGATYLFAFLNVATTNLYSSARAKHGETSNQAEAVVRTSARVALRCGLGLMFFLLLTSRFLLNLYMGEKAANTPGLLDAATDYVNIRALSMPTSLLFGVLQAALLGAKDSVRPLEAILYCTITNVIGDFILVNRFRGGLQGAAIATTLAQWVSTAALLPAARQKLVADHNLGLWKKKKPPPASDGNANNSQELHDTVTGASFLGFAAPVLTLILGKLAAFGFMTHTAAAVPGQPTPLASHQIILSLLFFCSPFLEVISQTAQTFLPPFTAPVMDYIRKQKEKNPQYDSKTDSIIQPWVKAAQSVATQLLWMGFVAGGMIASLASLIPARFGYFITTDSVIQKAIQPMAKYLWLGAFFWAPVAVSEGVLLARLELKFLASVYLLSTALLPPVLLRIKHQGGTVGQVWSCFVIFQLFRAILFTGRIWGGFALQHLFGDTRRQSSSALPTKKKPA